MGQSQWCALFLRALFCGFKGKPKDSKDSGILFGVHNKSTHTHTPMCMWVFPSLGSRRAHREMGAAETPRCASKPEPRGVTNLFLGVDSWSILFDHRSFQKSGVLPEVLEVSGKKFGSLERMEMEGTPRISSKAVALMIEFCQGFDSELRGRGGGGGACLGVGEFMFIYQAFLNVDKDANELGVNDSHLNNNDIIEIK